MGKNSNPFFLFCSFVNQPILQKPHATKLPLFWSAQKNATRGVGALRVYAYRCLAPNHKHFYHVM